MDIVDGTILNYVTRDEWIELTRSNRRRRLSAIITFVLKLTFMMLCLVDSWFNVLSHETRENIRSVNVLVILTLIPYGLMHIYYTCVLIPESLDWKLHLLASLTDVLFILMAVLNYRESADIKRGILISYLSACSAYLTLPLFAESLKLAGIATVIFKCELMFFFYGLSLIGVALMRERFERQPRSNTN